MEDDGSKFIGNYEIIGILLESAEGVIYRAVQQPTGDKVIIKKYYPALRWSDDVLNEFFNLAGYLRFIEHDYILSVVDIGKDDGRPYVVFADTVTSLLCDREGRQLTQKETVGFLTDIAEALDFLHKQEVLHGGLTPANIAIDPNGFPLMFDFGLSGVFKKLLLENMDDSFENLSVTDLKCAPPEQILGRNPTRASDVYSFGVVAYYYIFDKFPFEGQFAPETALAHLSGDLVPVQLPQVISSDTLQLVQKCVQVDPDKRFTGFSQILGTLERMKSSRKVRLRFEKRFAVKTRPIPHRFPTRLAQSFVGIVVLGLSLFAVYHLFSNRTEAPLPVTTLTATKTVAVQPTQTQKPGATPTTVVVTTLTIPVETGYRLAFEGERPYDASEVISIANLSGLREISRLGYGKPEDTDIASDGIHAAIATSAGVFIFEGNQFLRWIDPQGWATSVQFSPDGGTLAVGLASGEIQLWDWQTGKRSTSLTGEWRHTGKINRLLFSQSGYLFSASADRQVIIWDWKSGTSIRGIPAHSQPVNDIAVTSDGRILVSCSDDKLIRVWDLATQRKLYELDSSYFSGSIRAVALSSDDAFLAAGGASGYLYQWNFLTSPLPAGDSLQRRTDIVPVASRIWSIQYIRDDEDLLLGVDDGGTLTYDASRVGYEGIPLVFEIPARQKDLYDAYGNNFDFASQSVFRGDNTISINWNGAVTYQRNQIVSPMFDNLDHLDFSPDGSILAAGGKYGSTHVWNLTTNEPLYKNFYTMPFGEPISPDGSTIAILVPASDARIGDLYQLKKLTGAQTTVDLSTALPGGRVGYTRDGSVFIAADMTTSKAWDFVSGIDVDVQAQDYFGCRITAPKKDVRDRLLVNSAIDIFLPGDDAHMDSLCPKSFQVRNSVSAFSRDLNLLAFINANGLLEAYDVLRMAMPWPPYRLEDGFAVTSMAVSPDSAIIAVGDASGRILFFDGRIGQPLGEIVANFGSLQAIEFSDDGTKIATAGTDGVVRVFGIVEVK
jgi:WD40 repeat protein/serine/threonine protein kinase